MSILFIPKLTGLTQSYSVLSCFILNVKISQPWERIFLCLFCKSEDRVRLSHLQTPGPQEGLATGQQTSLWPSRGPGAGNSESFRESTAAPACPRVYGQAGPGAPRFRDTAGKRAGRSGGPLVPGRLQGCVRKQLPAHTECRSHWHSAGILHILSLSPYKTFQNSHAHPPLCRQGN